MEIKQAYEAYSLVGGGYNKRHLHGYAWTREGAHDLARASLNNARFHIGVVHLAQVGDNWHRIHAIPVGAVSGNIEDAEVSRILRNDIPVRDAPSINFQIDGGPAQRLGLDLAKCIDTIVAYGATCECRLYTARIGGRLPLTFRVRDLRLSEHTQQQVVSWLQYEINFRIEKAAQK